MSYRAIIFDLFGTIVDGFAASSVGYQEQFAAALGVPHDSLMQQWRQLTDRRTLGEFQTVEESIAYVCNIIGARVTAGQIVKAVETRLQLTRHALRPTPGAIATFQRLKDNGFKIGLLSNCSIEIPIVWPETEFADIFDATVFSARERVKKPAPEIYHRACQHLAIAADECLYVADGENYELAAARNVGMHPVLIRPTSKTPQGETFQEAREWQGPTITALTEVLAMVEK